MFTFGGMKSIHFGFGIAFAFPADKASVARLWRRDLGERNVDAT